MKRKYRVVRDKFCGFEAQVWRPWWPFWRQLGFTNTHSSLERAIQYIKNHGEVVWRSDDEDAA